MTMLARDFTVADVVNHPVADRIEALRAAQMPIVPGMPHPPRQRREYLMALAEAYEAGELVLASEIGA
ncbi:hypothetical protein [Psychromarinibacter halotolerans]|uniref:Uncharacterized protein n=1 Tax=Psychromarinibacter halotolerans TaxID=1775175 RepID=A0ABV7GYP7_9RHOB|nr:hypothetical protein [Psychromarinibacter halotolerans]MDF0598962.1 hypothetical protein [Psychromarinibacter halotolerans]